MDRTTARAAVQSSLKSASSQEQYEEAALILEKKAEHAAIKMIKEAYEDVLKAIEEADKRSKGMKRMGVGRTEDANLVVSHVVPAIEELGEQCKTIANQMKERFGGPGKHW